jgi:hypothetical protein
VGNSHGSANERDGSKIFGRVPCAALLLLAVGAIMVEGASVRADTIVASDNAGNSPYVVGVAPNVNLSAFSGQNGGSGFGPWSVASTAGSSQGGDFISSNTWSGVTPWFDIWQYVGGQTTATRPLNSVLSSGETLSFDFVLSADATGGAVGFYLSDSGGNPLFSFYQMGNTSTAGYAIDANGTTSGVGVQYNFHTLDHMAFQLTSATTYNFDVNNALAFSGTISNATGGITSLNFFDSNGGPSSDVQFTNLSISSPVPVPASFGLLACGMGAALVLNKRRRVKT